MDTKFRLALAALISLLPLLPLAYRLARLQVFEHRSLETKASGEFSRNAQEVVPRADILDRKGNILAQSIPVWTAFVDKRMVADIRPLAPRLGRLLGLSTAEIAKRYSHGGDRVAALRRDLSYEESQAVSQAKIEGIGIESSQERFYPNGELARSLLGQVTSDGRGAAGIELSLDSRLSRKARLYKVIHDGSGRVVNRSLERDAPAPQPLKLTIDRNLQYIAEEALAEASKQFSATQGIAAIQDPNTGELLAMAVYPPNPLKNPIVQDTYEPGSTFKVITAVAALDQAVVSEDETFFCENGSWEVAPGTIIHDHEPEGDLTLAGILEHSSNIGAAKIGERLGAARFYRYARAFGFASKTSVPLPGETAGQLRPLSESTRVGLAASSYGYGVAVSALQMLSAYSAIANGGILYEPRLVKDDAPPAKVRRVASAKTMERLSRMLEGVVEKGTGETARIQGYRVAGKTGTARRIDPMTRKYSTSQYNASFLGFLPASTPRWTILVVLENPRGSYYGAQVSAPVFAKIARQLLALNGVAADKPQAVAIAAASGAARPARSH